MFSSLIRLVLLFAILALAFESWSQERFDSGPYKGFAKEDPELNKIELPKGLAVSKIIGTVVYGENEPIRKALFEIRDISGRVLSAVTNAGGTFEIPNVDSGTYSFKVTKNGFHSVVGTVVVGRKLSRKPIRIQLQLGT